MCIQQVNYVHQSTVKYLSVGNNDSYYPLCSTVNRQLLYIVAM